MSLSDSDSHGDQAIDDSSDESYQPDSSQETVPNRQTSERLLSYVNSDPGPPDTPPKFKPDKDPGFLLPDEAKSGAGFQRYLSPLAFFKLFFTLDIVTRLCDWTNDCAEEQGPLKPTLYQGWKDITPEEMYQFFALLMYMAVIKAPNIEIYWSTAPLYHGLWARHFMSKLRFKAIHAFLKACDTDPENDASDKLCEVRLLHDYIRRRCFKLYQPYKNVSIGERTFKNCGRFRFKQYIQDKPARWDMKLWVLADSSSGYTCDFEVRTGKGVPVSRHGLAYDVVMRLCQNFAKQGYRVFFDNFYTGVQLVKDLLVQGVLCCGAILPRRKGVSAAFKDTKAFCKGSNGAMRWKREGSLVFLQWLDDKPFTFLSTIHRRATKFRHVKRRAKFNGQYRPVFVRQPVLVDKYSRFMSGVGKSDQLIGKYATLRKTHQWWKTLFFHCLDVARVNSYILFNDFRKKNSEYLVELQRPRHYSQLDFTVELIREIGHITEELQVPLFNFKEPPPFSPDHGVVPAHGETPKSCNLCYKRYQIERKTLVMCKTCKKHFCFISKRNCLLEAHQ